MPSLDEHGAGAHGLARGGHRLKVQHIVRRLIQVPSHELQHFVAERGADVPTKAKGVEIAKQDADCDL